MTIEDYLAVPYILTMESVQRADGEWVRRAAHPELPGCVAEAYSPVDAIDQLDQARRQRILELLEQGEPVPVPRPPLAHRGRLLDPDRLGFARWLVENERLSDHGDG